MPRTVTQQCRSVLNRGTEGGKLRGRSPDFQGELSEAQRGALESKPAVRGSDLLGTDLSPRTRWAQHCLWEAQVTASAAAMMDLEPGSG